MPQTNKDVLLAANAAIAGGDHEGFLRLCTDDTRWEFIGDRVLHGKEEVRRYMAQTYETPPKFDVADVVEQGELVVAVGEIELVEAGQTHRYGYCDVWRLREGKLAELRAYVVPLK